jgi:predicted  nucleic acid-binding Zn-ribbon protein
MAVINYTDQLKYAGSGYLDAKMNPVASVADLKSISRNQRFIGLTVTVLNDGNPQDYWLVNGTSNDNWVPKNDLSALKLTLEKGWLRLSANGTEISSVDFNGFIPENGGDGSDKFVSNVQYSDVNENGEAGIFMQFSYNDGSELFLDMAPYIQGAYEEGEGISINGKVISVSEALLNRVASVEATLVDVQTALAGKADKTDLDGKATTADLEVVRQEFRETEGEIRKAFKEADDELLETIETLDNDLRSVIASGDNAVRAEITAGDTAVRGEITKSEERLREEIQNVDKELKEMIENLPETGGDNTELKNKVDALDVQVKANTQEITNVKVDINTLQEQIKGLVANKEGMIPDGKTIGITDDEQKALMVKVSTSTDGNIMGVAEDNSGLYAVIPCYCEDAEINE